MNKKTNNDVLLGHIITRLTDNEVATSDIKDMLLKLNSTMNEIVDILDIVLVEDAGLEDMEKIKNIQSKNTLTQYVISDYFKNNREEAEEMLEQLLKEKVLNSVLLLDSITNHLFTEQLEIYKANSIQR